MTSNKTAPSAVGAATAADPGLSAQKVLPIHPTSGARSLYTLRHTLRSASPRGWSCMPQPALCPAGALRDGRWATCPLLRASAKLLPASKPLILSRRRLEGWRLGTMMPPPTSGAAPLFLRQAPSKRPWQSARIRVAESSLLSGHASARPLGLANQSGKSMAGKRSTRSLPKRKRARCRNGGAGSLTSIRSAHLRVWWGRLFL